MTTRPKKPPPLDKRVAAVAKAVDVVPIADRLASIVATKLAKAVEIRQREEREIARQRRGGLTSDVASGGVAITTRQRPARPTVIRRRSSGANRAYSVTERASLMFRQCRRNTWRWYMLDTIMAYATTRSAEDAHKVSGKYADKTLDFSWAAKEGYIQF